TLSPALAALLLKPRQNGSSAALPRLAFVLLGAWLGWKGLTAWLPEAPGWAPWLAPVAGAALGWLVGRPVNWVLGWSFRLFNGGFAWSTGLYARTIGGLLRVSAL